jgi:REP element-mobilizing transposase RayT
VDASVVDRVREQIVRTCEEHAFAEVASVCMPDHVHALFEGQQEDSAFVPFMKLLRQRTTRAYKARAKRKLWQDGYFEHVLRDEETTPSVVAYILGNPVRGRLVEKPEDYPYVWCKYGLKMFDIVSVNERPAWTRRRN